MAGPKNRNPSIPIFIVSGGKGIAGHTMVNSLIIQYPDNRLPVHILSEVQTKEKIIEVVQKVKQAGGIISHSMINSDLRRILKETCAEYEVREFDFMGPLADFLEKELGLKSVNAPGLYRKINAQYYERVEAIEYTLNHDDGMNTHRLFGADIVLTGVSRSGKTPLSVYMSMFGWKVANVPIIKDISPPEELFQVDRRRVFGLNISPSHLITQRVKRLEQMGNLLNKDYIDNAKVRQELRYANFIFEKGEFTVVSVNNKPIESSANEIIGMFSERFGHQDRKIKPGT